MANWMTAGRETSDNLGILLHRLAGVFLGVGLAAKLCRDLPSIAGWLESLGLLFALVFLVLSQSRSKTLIQNAAEVQRK